MEQTILESFAYVLPSLVTGLVAYYMFNGFLVTTINEKKIQLLAQQKKESLPIKLQAYERLLLFCDRVNPIKILMRIPPISNETKDYLELLIANINQEFEHNLVQQIYVSDETWTAVLGAKNAVINKLKQAAEESSTANNFRENILIDYSKILPPTETAIILIKKEVKTLL
ncbi:hypothetical protein [Polaribacter tangerinus]|uniref:DUF7935 family protein n=1 Tax=Polaribacter tangerinus TaxID=1920034 RepID=UPI000B4C12CC|nr:hypothetical protein [Polaribacter tangerinus]